MSRICPNPVPVIVIISPGTPIWGLIDVIVGFSFGNFVIRKIVPKIRKTNKARQAALTKGNFLK